VLDKVSLDISIAEYPHTQKILSGEIPIEGVEPNFIDVKPQIGAYRRMVRDHEFDVCEIAPTTYIIARSYGAPFVGLPIFLMRQINHGTLLGIEMPDVTRALRRASEAAGILGSERQRRDADGLIRDDHATRQRHFLHQT
jgi:hypothetical protein